VNRPILRTSSLTVASPQDQVLEAYVLDLADWVGYGLEQEKLLDVYRQNAPATAPK
jgi:hypothetical protein